MKPSWKFGNNDTREVEGPNNAGIANFTDDRTGGLVREVIQNSIDASASQDEPVKVAFRVEELLVQDLDLGSLKQAISASRKSHAIDDRHSRQFQRGISTLNSATKNGRIVALSIVDSNTTGASDNNGQRDKWHSLTKTVGLGNKDMLDAGGSFGLGKHAAFAATDLRTVLYSTAYYQNGIGSPLRRRFTGKSILVSHEVGGKAYRASGWLEADDGPLRDNEIPGDFRLKSPGTAIAILGFDNSNMDQWQAEAKESLITHFFHALAHDNLRVRIGDSDIDSENLDNAAADMDESVRNLIEVSRSEIKDHTDIKGIGRVNLRIQVDEYGESSRKTVALVRDAGMMITSQLGNMLITPAQRMVSFPRHWLGFTAIVECLSQGERSLLREAEGPRHDKVSADHADSYERRKVSSALRSLGIWIRDTIEKHAKPPEPATTDNADELADILPLSGSGVQSPIGNGRGNWAITEPSQASRAPRGLRAPGRRRRTTTRDLPGGSEQGTPNGKGKGKGKRRRRGKRVESIQVAFGDLRRLPSELNQWPEHTARFTFSPPQGVIKHVRLYAVGEDGRDVQIPLERAYIADRRLSVKQGEIDEIPPDRIYGDRVDLELKAISPIANKRLEIRLASRERATNK